MTTEKETLLSETLRAISDLCTAYLDNEGDLAMLADGLMEQAGVLFFDGSERAAAGVPHRRLDGQVREVAGRRLG